MACRNEEIESRTFKSRSKSTKSHVSTKSYADQIRVEKEDEISKKFPNFAALTKEERLAFFEALTTARKNVEKRGPLTRDTFGTVHDEYLNYFHNKESSLTCLTSESSKVSFAPSEVHIVSKNSSCSLPSSPTEALPHVVKTSESENGSLVPGSGKPDFDSWDEYEPFLEKNRDKIIDLYLKKKKKEERWLEEDLDVKQLTDLDVYDLRENQKSCQIMAQHSEAPKQRNKENILPEEYEPSVKPERFVFPKLKATPRFDVLNAEEREIFFTILREAHENILVKDPGKKNEIISVETILKRYQHEHEEPLVHPKVFKEQDKFTRSPPPPPPVEKNVRVKVTVKSVDNERLEKEAKEREQLRRFKAEASKKATRKDSVTSDDSSEIIKEYEAFSSKNSGERKAREVKTKNISSDAITKCKPKKNLNTSEPQQNLDKTFEDSIQIRSKENIKAENQKIPDQVNEKSMRERETSVSLYNEPEKKESLMDIRPVRSNKKIENQTPDEVKKETKNEKQEVSENPKENEKEEEKEKQVEFEKVNDNEKEEKNEMQKDNTKQEEDGKQVEHERPKENEMQKNNETQEEFVKQNGNEKQEEYEKKKKNENKEENEKQAEKIEESASFKETSPNPTEMKKESHFDTSTTHLDHKDHTSSEVKSDETKEKDLPSVSNEKKTNEDSVALNEKIKEEQNIKEESKPELDKIPDENRKEVLGDKKSVSVENIKQVNEKSSKKNIETETVQQKKGENPEPPTGKIDFEISLDLKNSQKGKDREEIKSPLTKENQKNIKLKSETTQTLLLEEENLKIHPGLTGSENSIVVHDVVKEYKTGKVVLVGDDVIQKITQLVQDLEIKTKEEEPGVENEYLQLLLDYIEYLTAVLESLMSQKHRKKEKKIETQVTPAEVRLKFDDEIVAKSNSKTKKDKSEFYPRSVSDTEMPGFRTSKTEKIKISTEKLPEKKSSLLIKSDSESESSLDSYDNEMYETPITVRKKKLPNTKIRLLQDLLKDRATFVEGSIDDFKVVSLPVEDYVPPKTKRIMTELTDESENFSEKNNRLKFLRTLAKFCKCWKTETRDEDEILENLKGEAVAVDITEGKTRDAVSATLNESTMEVLKAAERKRVIQKRWKAT